MPDWKSIVRKRLEPLGLTLAAESSLTDEVAQHLEDQYGELLSGGTSEQEAYQRVLAELSDIYPLRTGLESSQRMPKYETVAAGDARRGNLLEDLWRDLRYAVRQTRKNYAFASFVVLTLGLGIGANTTVFTVINTLILNSLPVRNSAQLAALSRATKSGSQSNAILPISYPDLKDYRDRNTVFSSVAGYTSPRGITWQTDSGSQGMFSEFVTGNYFATLGLNPANGRFFSPEEDGSPGAYPVAVMNYGTWQARFGAAADMVGKTLRLNGVVVTVIGIAPQGFIGVNAIFGPDLWMPAAMAESLLPNQMQATLKNRSKADFQGVGRYQTGVTQSQALANLSVIAADLARAYPEVDEGQTAMVRPIRDAVFSSSFGASTPILFVGVTLLVVVGIVLLIACSNVANLLLARAAARQQEMAVRLAMGASSARLMRQLLTESILLGCLSGVLGLLLSYAGLRILFGALPATANFATPRLDATVLVFAVLLSLATGVIFGILPAFKASRSSVAEALKEEARTAGRSRKKITIGRVLLVGQVAFSFLLLVTASLFLRSIGRAYGIDPGFQPAHLAVITTNPGQAGYGKAQTKAFYRDVRDRVVRMPDVESVSWASSMPLWAKPVTGLNVEGWEQRSRTDKIATIVNTVDRDYFETVGLPIESGRGFTAVDQPSSTAVAIVNEKLARDYWGGAQSLGKRIQLPNEKQMRQVVGVVRTANYSAWGEPQQACVYVPLEQNYSDAMILYVRSKGVPQQLLIPIRHEIGAAGPQVLVGGTLAGREIIDRGLFQARLGVVLLSLFGLLALGLASIGLYGIVAYSVGQRKREIGLRMALGAAQSNVLQLILKEGMSLVLTGVLIGLAAALLTGRFLSRVLYGISGSDPVSVAGAAVVLVSVALLACYLPARWASRVDPLVALRNEG